MGASECDEEWLVASPVDDGGWWAQNGLWEGAWERWVGRLMIANAGLDMSAGKAVCSAAYCPSAPIPLCL